MPSSKYMTWELTEQTTTHSTRSTAWELQREVIPASQLVAGRTYMIYAWANCLSPGTNDGGTKWAFIGGSDLDGSTQEKQSKYFWMPITGESGPEGEGNSNHK